MNKLEKFERSLIKQGVPEFRPGDTVRVHLKVSEGDKERTQIFEGVVIKINRKGPRTSFTVRKISYGVGVERIFPLYAPVVEKIEVKQKGRVRRSRLFYLRERSGKSARIKEKRE